MPINIVGILQVLFQGDASQLQSEATKATTAVDRFDKSASQSGGKIQQVFGRASLEIEGIGAAISKLGPIIAGSLVAKLVGDFVEMSGALVDLEAKTGISVRGLQKLKGATQESGVELATVARTALALQKKLGEGTDSFVAALERVGLEYKTIRELSPEEALFAVGDAIGKITDQNTKVAATNEILTKIGVEALPALNGKLKETADAFERMGLVIDDDVIRAGDALGDQWTVLKSAGSALLAAVIGPLLPGVVALTGGLLSLGNAGAPVIKFFLELVGMPFEKSINLIDDLGESFDLLTLKAQKLADLPKPPDLATALVPPGGLKMLDADEIEQISDALTESAKERIEENKKAAAALEKEVEAAKRLRDVWSGANAFTEAQKLTDQIEELGGVTKLTTEEQKRLLSALQAAIDKYNALGQSAPQDVLATTIELDAMITRLKDARSHVEILGLEFETSLQKANLATTGFDPLKSLEPFKTPAVAQGVGVSLGSEIVDGIGATFRTQLGPTIMAAITGGGNIGQAIGGLLGQSITSSLATPLQRIAPEFMKTFLGGIVGSFLPGIGALLGPALGKITDWFSGLFGVSKEVREARSELEGFQKTLRGSLTETQRLEAGTDGWRQDVVRVRDAFLAVGRSEAEALAIVRQLWDTDNPDAMRRAIEEITRVLEEEKRLAGESADAQERAADAAEERQRELSDALRETNDRFAPFLSKSEELGIKLPDALEKALVKLRAMGVITGENARALDRLVGMTNGVSVDRMREIGERLGIRNLDALGPAFNVGRIGQSATSIVGDLEGFIRGGGNIGGLLSESGFQQILRDLATDALRHGTALPGQLRQFIEEAARNTPTFSRESGFLGDLSKLEFGPDAKTEFQENTQALEALVRELETGDLVQRLESGGLVTALGENRTIDALNDNKLIDALDRFNPEITVRIPEPRGPMLDRNVPFPIPEMARGGLVRGPTLALLGEVEPELVIPFSALSKFGGDVPMPAADIPIPRVPFDAAGFDRTMPVEGSRGSDAPRLVPMPFAVVMRDSDNVETVVEAVRRRVTETFAQDFALDTFGLATSLIPVLSDRLQGRT